MYFRACLKCDKDHNYGDIILANQNTCQENNPASCPWLVTEKNTNLDYHYFTKIRDIVKDK